MSDRFDLDCDYCGAHFQSVKEDARFHTDKCRAAWHREHDPAGIIRGVRKLANGGVSIIVHLPAKEFDRAMRFNLKQTVVVGAVDEHAAG